MNLSHRAMIIGFATISVLGAAQAAYVSPAFSLVSPSAWSVGSSGSTSQDWGANTLDAISGVPNVSYNDAGAGLTLPTLAASGAFLAGSGGYYGLAPYSAYTTISNNSAGAPVNAGTHVIVQGFSTLNEASGITGVTLTDSLGASISGAVLLGSSIYGYTDSYAASYGTVSAQAVIYEFWLPDYTGDIKVTLSAKEHVSLLEVRVDTKIASADVGGGSPFALTAVPEPASLSIAGLAAVGLLMRRRK